MSKVNSTDLESIPEIVQSMDQSFHTRDLDNVNLRIQLIKSIYNMLINHQSEIEEALLKDFNKPRFETVTQELNPVLVETRHVLDNIKTWIKPTTPSSTPALPFLTMGKKLEKIPLGTILVISAFNFPLYIGIPPIVGALAAGNCVIFKPSELTVNFTNIITKLFDQYIDKRYVQVINGGIPETTKLLEQKFDKIIYTGSGKVGKIVAKAAANHLTPVILELGGKSPAILSNSLNDSQLIKAVKRIIWAKFTNAGQICVDVDYLLVDESIHDKVIEIIKKIVIEFYKDVDANSLTYAHIGNKNGFNRLINLIGKTKGVLITGAVTDESKNYISPTVYTNVDWNDVLMEDEIFGPILPIIKYNNINRITDLIIKNHDTPLAAYIFSNNSQEIQIYKQKLRSGSLFINDILLQNANMSIPFGGIGTSGYGTYHGKASFDAFSHERLVLTQSYWTEPIFEARYPPFNDFNQRVLTGVFHPLGTSLEWIEKIKFGLVGFLVLMGGFIGNFVKKFFSN